RLDRAMSPRDVSDRSEVGPSEAEFVRLMKRGTDEQRVLSELLGETREASFDATVKVALGVEVLTARHDVIGEHRGQRPAVWHKSVAIPTRYAVRSFEVHEVSQRRFTERQ